MTHQEFAVCAIDTKITMLLILICCRYAENFWSLSQQYFAPSLDVYSLNRFIFFPFSGCFGGGVPVLNNMRDFCMLRCFCFVFFSTCFAEPINTFHGIHQNNDEPIRVSYHRNIHYNSVVNPNKATIGVGLGLPAFKPGVSEEGLCCVRINSEVWTRNYVM